MAHGGFKWGKNSDFLFHGNEHSVYQVLNQAYREKSVSH